MALSLYFPLRLISKDNFYSWGRFGKCYIPKRFKDFDSSVITLARAQLPNNFSLLEGSLYVIIECGFKRAKGRPLDSGNIPKSILDALNGVVWKDDGLIDYLYIKRIKNAEKNYIHMTIQNA